MQESPYLFTNLNSNPEFYNQQEGVDYKGHANAVNYPKDFIEVAGMDAYQGNVNDNDGLKSLKHQTETPTSVIVVSVLGGTLVVMLAVIVGIAYVRRRKATVSETALLLDN